jgi:predicted nucleic-acid-binding Zn-ribbon protein
MGLMSNTDMEKAAEYLKKKYLGCPNCGALNMEIRDIVGLPFLERLPSSITPGKQYIAVLPVICSSCGFVTLFAAKNFMSLD